MFIVTKFFYLFSLALFVFLFHLPIIFAETSEKTQSFNELSPEDRWRFLTRDAKVKPDNVDGLFNMLNLSPSENGEIVILTFNPNLGDNIIFEYSKIESLHKKYPKAKITIISPTSSILKKSDWLNPVTIDTKDLYNSNIAAKIEENPNYIFERFKKIIEDHIHSKSFIVMDKQSLLLRLYEELKIYISTSLANNPKHEKYVNLKSSADTIKWDLHYKKGNYTQADLDRAESLSSLAEKEYKDQVKHQYKLIDELLESLFRTSKWVEDSTKLAGGITVNLFRNEFKMSVDVSNAIKPKLNGSKITKVSSLSDQQYRIEFIDKDIFDPDGHLTKTNMRSTYETAQYEADLLWGKSMHTYNHVRNYSDLDALEPERKKFILGTFEKPKQDYIIVNLNTRGQYKIDGPYGLKRDYAERLSDLLDLIRIEHPHMNILVAQVEDQFGKTNQEQVAKIMQNCGNQCAFLPRDQSLWSSLISKASGVITQDSGFTHVANIYLPPERVLIYSRSLQKDPEKFSWKMPGQSVFIDDGDPDPGMKSKFKLWLSSKLTTLLKRPLNLNFCSRKFEKIIDY